VFCETPVSFCETNTPRYNLIIQDVSYQISTVTDDFYCQPVTATATRLLYAWITLDSFQLNEENGGLSRYKTKFYGRLVNQDGTPTFFTLTDTYLSTRWFDATYKFSQNVDQKCRIYIAAMPQSPLGTQRLFGDSLEGLLSIEPHI
jgi:hypothetical protein